jgi:hypothetical protein
MKSLWKLAAIVSAAALVSCGGGGSDTPTPVAANNTAIALNPTTGATAIQAISGQSVAFPTGVPAFGTTTPTAVTITAGTTPKFAISEGGKTASGNLTFGSCIFTVTASTFTTGPLVNNNVITINPCVITLGTQGVNATGAAVTVPVTVTFNTTTSSPPLQDVVTISPGGVITINGNVITLTPVATVTGTGS